jgi:hypothetical protein
MAGSANEPEGRKRDDVVEADFMCGIYIGIILTIWIALVVLVYRDAEDKGMAGTIWGLLVLAFGPFAVGYYVAVRPRRKSKDGYPIEYPPPVAPPPQGLYLQPPVRYTPPGRTFCRRCGRSIAVGSPTCPACGERA